jgi:hypothetical protein
MCLSKIFLSETSEVGIDAVIEKLKACYSNERYRAQTTILDRIVQSSTILEKKTKLFWRYFLNDIDSWRSHHSIIMNLIRFLCHIEHSQHDQQREGHIRCSIASFRKRVHRLKDSSLPSHLHILSYSTDIDITVCNPRLWHRWRTTAFLPQMLQVKSA